MRLGTLIYTAEDINYFSLSKGEVVRIDFEFIL